MRRWVPVFPTQQNFLTYYYLTDLPIAYLQPTAEHAYREGALARSEYRLEVEPLVNSHVHVRHASLTTILITY